MTAPLASLRANGQEGWHPAQSRQPGFDVWIDEPCNAEESVVVLVQVKAMDRLMMGDSVAETAEFGDWNVDVSAALRNQEGKGVA
jgi:hypothetical protein